MTTVLVAVVTGVVVLLAGSLPWIALLAPANLRFGNVAPWAIAPMALYLWCYWKYIGGSWGSTTTAAERRANLRANALSAEVWGAAIGAGLLGFAALVALVLLMARLISLPPSAALTAPEGMPPLTAFLLLVMASVVAGVTEEAAFRGYMQGPVERRYGPVLAILVNGAMFGVLHFPNHPNGVWKMLPYYIAVAAVYGGLTWAANSILPALVLHAGGDVWSLTRLWLTGKPEWQLAPSSENLVWETGIDARFLVTAAAFVALAALTWRAYAGIRAMSKV